MRFHLPAPSAARLPNADELELLSAHSEGRLIYESAAFPKVRLRIVPREEG